MKVPVYSVVWQKERLVDNFEKYFHFFEFDLIQYHSTFEFCPDSSRYPMQEFSNLDSSFWILQRSHIPYFLWMDFKTYEKEMKKKIILGILGEFWGSLWLNPVPAPINPISYWISFFGLSENCESFKAVEYFLEPLLWLVIYLNFLASFGSYVIYILVYFKYTIMTERIFWLQLNDRLNYTIL